MKQKKIEEDLLVLIRLRFAHISYLHNLVTSAHSGIVAPELIIEWKSFIILKNTKWSSARVTQAESSPATTVICAPLHILRKRSLWIFCTNLRQVFRITKTLLIFTCSILKLCGAHTLMLSILETLAFTLITGRISEENLIFSIMKESSVHNGKQSTLFKPMLTAAKMSIAVNSPTVGRSKNIILWITRFTHADKVLNVKSHIAHTITMILIEDSP